MSEAIELVVFSAKPGVKDTELKAAALSVTPILEKMPGYLSREFGASGDGQYVDIVRWKDLASAQAAAQQVMKIPECGKFFALIDESKMQFSHFQKVK